MGNSEIIKGYVVKKVSILQNGTPNSKAELAKMRRGLGKDVSESVDSWEFIYKDLPDSLSGKGDNVSEAERAIHIALTLYAMHQQGSDRSVHIQDVGFGQAMSSIVNPDKGNEDAVIRRFNSLITADDISELSTHLRNMVQLMKSSDRFIGFDYGRLASDLYSFQFPDGKRDVKIRWGKQFYSYNGENKVSDSE